MQTIWNGGLSIIVIIIKLFSLLYWSSDVVSRTSHTSSHLPSFPRHSFGAFLFPLAWFKGDDFTTDQEVFIHVILDDVNSLVLRSRHEGVRRLPSVLIAGASITEQIIMYLV